MGMAVYAPAVVIGAVQEQPSIPVDDPAAFLRATLGMRLEPGRRAHRSARDNSRSLRQSWCAWQ